MAVLRFSSRPSADRRRRAPCLGHELECAPALAAFDRNAQCLDGGGSSNPLDANVPDATVQPDADAGAELDAQNDVNAD